MGKANEIDRRMEDLLRQKDWPAILKLLADGVIEPDQVFVISGVKITALISAVSRGWTELALELIQRGADANKRFMGASPLLIACEGGHQVIIDALLAAGAEVNVKSRKQDGEADTTPLMSLAERVDAWSVQRVLDAGADVTVVNSHKQTALHCALNYYWTGPQPKPDALPVVQALLDAGCPMLGTELHFTVYRRDVAMTRLLLDRGCPVNALFPRNATDGPRKDDTPLVTLARLNAVDLAGGCFDFPPTEEPRRELARMLLAAGADPNLPGQKGWTPLGLLVPKVANEESLRLAEILVAGGADPCLVPPKAKVMSPLAAATQNRVQDFVSLFERARSQ